MVPIVLYCNIIAKYCNTYCKISKYCNAYCKNFQVLQKILKYFQSIAKRNSKSYKYCNKYCKIKKILQKVLQNFKVLQKYCYILSRGNFLSCAILYYSKRKINGTKDKYLYIDCRFIFDQQLD